MFTVIDHSNNQYDYPSIVPAMQRFIAMQHSKEHPQMYKDGRRVSFRTSPASARAAGYSEKEIFDQLADLGMASHA